MNSSLITDGFAERDIVNNDNNDNNGATDSFRSLRTNPESLSVPNISNEIDLNSYCTISKKLKNFIKSHNNITNSMINNISNSDGIGYEKLVNENCLNNLSNDTIKMKNQLRCKDNRFNSLRNTYKNKNHNLQTGYECINNFVLNNCWNENENKTKNLENIQIDTNETSSSVQDQYESMNHQESLVEAYNILSELDEILAQNEIRSKTPISMVQSDDESNEISSSPEIIENIEDCLYELDNYLDKIDNSISNIDSNLIKYDDDSKTINFKRSNTLPKTLKFFNNTDTLENHENKNDNGKSFFQRGHLLRNTIAALKNKISISKNLQSDLNVELLVDDDSLLDEEPSSIRKLWRRNSMRKTSLLALPHQNYCKKPVENEHSERFSEVNENIENRQTFCINNQNNSEIDFNEDLSGDSLQINNINSSSRNQSIPITDLDDLSDVNSAQLDSLNNLDLANNLLNNSIYQGDQLPTNSSQTNHLERPRQLGRRAEGHTRIMSIQTENLDTGLSRIIVNHDRPMSAPATTFSGRRPDSNLEREQNYFSTANMNNNPSSRYIGSETTSIGSSRNPSPVSLISSTGTTTSLGSNPDQEEMNSPPIRMSLDPENISTSNNQGINTFWPHEFSRILALLCCTLGLFNISRFAILTIHYGGNFLIQFLILSVIFGIPMLWLQMCLGSRILGGPASMWKISPICRGIGICLCLAQCIIALYSTISLSWILVFLRDSFVRKHENYKWQEQFYIFRRHINISTVNLTETIPDYFNGIVLQRWQLGLNRRIETNGVRFQLAFNLSIIWTIVFLILCKGLRSFGKIVIALTAIPFTLLIVVTCKFLYIIDFTEVQNIFSASDLEDFLINSKTWSAAAQETFLTWILLGPSVISISSRSTESNCRKAILRRDAIIVVLLTLIGLSLAALFGFACIQILQNHNYTYLTGSFEYMDTYIFLYSSKTPVPANLVSFPIKWTSHYSSVLGESFRRPTVPYRESGYQPLRLVTELFPAVVAVAENQISSAYTVFGYLMFLFFGLGQLCAMWKPVSSALGNSTSSVLLSCVTGLLLGIPFATEIGLSVIQYLDILIGGAWWISLIWAAQIFGVFLIRGRPYNGDFLVKDLKMNSSMSAFLALSWNVLLPIGLITLSVIQYKTSGTNQFFHWRGKAYFPFWARKLGSSIQVSFLIFVPIVSIIQIYRYLSSGPPDIFDRIQLLYRPTESPLPHRRATNQPAATIANLNSVEVQAVQEDTPPKYTPPPSYTTATGARLAKLLRQSIRRSVRRILGESSRQRLQDDRNFPPDYFTTECNMNPSGSTQNDENSETDSRTRYNNHRRLSIDNQRCQSASAFTAFDVAQVLSPSRFKSSRSAENLVLNAAPLGISNTIMNNDQKNENTSVI